MIYKGETTYTKLLIWTGDLGAAIMTKTHESRYKFGHTRKMAGQKEEINFIITGRKIKGRTKGMFRSLCRMWLET
jgi:hypothetical protein